MPAWSSWIVGSAWPIPEKGAGAVYAHLDEDLSGPGKPGAGRHPLPAPKKAARTFGHWGIGEGTQVVAYDDMSGAIASRLWWLLQWLGHEKVAVLNGGWTRWQAEGRPESAEKTKTVAKTFEPRPQPGFLIELDELKSRQAAGNIRMLDARATERYRGEEEPIDPVAGHIPGAVSAPHMAVVDKEGNWLPPAALETHFKTLLGEVPSEESVCYCGSGVTACRNILAIQHAGLGRPRLFAPSWSGWIANPEHPVATEI
jgi:thiosulfate/3-mercaptopyruvate sulfurtransferase